ncbi:MAG: putative bifunctional diguanylate cyclase/phosphodiesterase [Mycobacteriales bacterium]
MTALPPARGSDSADGGGHTLASVDLIGLLGAVAVSANEARDPGQALSETIRHVCQFTGWPVGHAYLVDRDGALEPTASWQGQGTESFAQFRTVSDQVPLPAGVGLPGRVLADRRPAWVVDVADDANFPRSDVALAAGLRAGFALPVLLGTDVVAVLEFFCPDVVEPDDRFLDVIGHLGRQLAQVFERDRGHLALSTSEARTRQILDSASEAFIGLDSDGLVTAWNEQAEIMFGWTRDEALGQPVADMIIPDDYRADHDAGMARFLATGEGRVLGQRLELEALRRSGECFPIELTQWAISSPEGWSFYAFGRDITARKAADADLAFRALHDDLTGLANRALVVDRLEQALARGARTGLGTGVLFVDLDRFKLVNDSLGHAAGDQLLQVAGQRIRHAVRPADTVGRFAGDEFLVVCENLADPTDATRVAERILTALSEPIDLEGDHVRLDASVGIALDTAPSTTAADLLREADAAMYRAKEHGRGRLEVFDERMRDRILNRLRTERELQGCLERDELRLHYQPIVTLPEGKVVGVEALVRWEHPVRGLLPPGEFIELAEETGMIVPIGSWVLEEACRQAQVWEAQGCEGLTLSINLSARQITQSDFVKSIGAIVEGANLHPGRVRIELEVTESLLMADPEAITATLAELRALGVALAIDDFGTGYSSLAYLKWFPIDTVKVDRSFISDIDTDLREQAIVQAVVDLAHALGLSVIGEGVETEAQRAKLAATGCDLAQGYLFAKPGPADTITPMLLSR